MFQIVDNFSTLTHSSFFKLSSRFVPEIRDLDLQEWEGNPLKVRLLDDASIGNASETSP
jgi:hypothetical protein